MVGKRFGFYVHDIHIDVSKKEKVEHFDPPQGLSPPSVIYCDFRVSDV